MNTIKKNNHIIIKCNKTKDKKNANTNIIMFHYSKI